MHVVGVPLVRPAIFAWYFMCALHNIIVYFSSSFSSSVISSLPVSRVAIDSVSHCMTKWWWWCGEWAAAAAAAVVTSTHLRLQCAARSAAISAAPSSNNCNWPRHIMHKFAKPTPGHNEQMVLEHVVCLHAHAHSSFGGGGLRWRLAVAAAHHKRIHDARRLLLHYRRRGLTGGCGCGKRAPRTLDVWFGHAMQCREPCAAFDTHTHAKWPSNASRCANEMPMRCPAHEWVSASIDLTDFCINFFSSADNILPLCECTVAKVL